MSSPATLLVWFQLRSPELAEDFERLMADDRDFVRGSLDTVRDWRLMQPADVPGQSLREADYVLIAEIVAVERWEQQASELLERLADDLAHLVAHRGLLVLRHPPLKSVTRSSARLYERGDVDMLDRCFRRTCEGESRARSRRW
jgi:hypothetical protein